MKLEIVLSGFVLVFRCIILDSFVLSWVFVCRPNRGFQLAFTARSCINLYQWDKTLRMNNDLLPPFPLLRRSFQVYQWQEAQVLFIFILITFTVPVLAASSRPITGRRNSGNNRVRRWRDVMSLILNFLIQTHYRPFMTFADFIYPQPGILPLVMKSKC